MSENQKDKGFTQEQLEELQIDSALGGDIPFVGVAGMIGRKGIPKVLEAVGPYIKKGVETAVESIPKNIPEVIEAAKTAANTARRLTSSVTTAEDVAKLDTTDKVVKDIAFRGIGAGVIIVAGSVAAVNYATSPSENEQNSIDFKNMVKTTDAREKFIALHPEGQNALDHLKLVENHFTNNGQLKLADLDDNAKGTIKSAIETIGNQIEDKGFNSFGKVSQELLNTNEQATVRH